MINGKIISFVIFLFAFSSFGQEVEEERIYDFAEIDPSFPGGEDAMVRFIQENVIYPELSRQQNEQGIVYVQFVVRKDGSISNIKVIKGVCERLDAEAMRVVSIMPNWIPAQNEGEKVSVRYTLPIQFVLSGKATKKKRK